MEEIKGKEIFMNPYVVQMDKFADSLKHLSRTFLKLKDIRGHLPKKSWRICFEKGYRQGL